MILFLHPASRFGRTLLLAVILEIVTACGIPGSHPYSPTTDPALYYVAQLMLSNDDVPKQWYDSGEFYNTGIANADALERGFSGSVFLQKDIFLKQELRVYESVPLAQEGYTAEEESNTFFMEKLHYAPVQVSFSIQADRFDYICSDTQGDPNAEQHCTAIQLYGNVFSMINVYIDGAYITHEQVESVLEQVDMKLAQFKNAPADSISVTAQVTGTP